MTVDSDTRLQDELVEVLAALRAPTPVAGAVDTSSSGHPANSDLGAVQAAPSRAAAPEAAVAPRRRSRGTSEPRSAWVLGRALAALLVVGVLGSLVWVQAQGATDDDESTHAVVAGATVPGADDAPAVVSQQVTVAGNQAWTDTGVACQTGKSVQMVATGTVFHDPSSGDGPEGSSDAGLRQFNLPGLADANHGSLAASLDAKAPFTVVGGSATYTCPAAGELFLGPNDIGVDNNHGEWTVTLTPSG